ncbi:MAG: hypothetical protein COA82_10405 [Alkaliphilus sp.]|nr:hypothetical protein [bacterium AH-315-K05]MBN4074686.1 hypothetical protein [bacterium AH-315-E09]PHS31288.1 MAG: hypothetical protein COA82_10405 [Alkaliphilus sp.]
MGKSTGRKFSKREAIKFGWETMKKNFWFFIRISLFLVFYNISTYFIGEVLQGESVLLTGGFWMLEFTGTLLIMMGLIKISLNFYDNKTSKFIDLFMQYGVLPKVIIANILNFVILIPVLLPSIVIFVALNWFFGESIAIMGEIIYPLYFALTVGVTIIWMIRVWFFDYFIVDKGSGPIEALKRSWRITKKATWQMCLFFLITIGINLLGTLFILIGLFVTVPTTLLAFAYVYRKLLESEECYPSAKREGPNLAEKEKDKILKNAIPHL